MIERGLSFHTISRLRSYDDGFQGAPTHEVEVDQNPSIEPEATVFSVFAESGTIGEITPQPVPDAYDMIQAERMAGGE